MQRNRKCNQTQKEAIIRNQSWHDLNLQLADRTLKHNFKYSQEKMSLNECTDGKSQQKNINFQMEILELKYNELA